MIHSIRFTAVLDTNVIYPVIIRDQLLYMLFCKIIQSRSTVSSFETRHGSGFAETYTVMAKYYTELGR